ncbi:MAG: hypothetical protein IVW57_04235 [Ktedonobacterales bacterium]|nr:hypothetical protein [Ktedonobacterales bacterium]
MRQSGVQAHQLHAGQFLLGFAGGFLPIVIEIGDLADSLSREIFSMIQALGCLAYIAALIATISCFASSRARSVGIGLLAGIVITTLLALVWAVAAASAT